MLAKDNNKTNRSSPSSRAPELFDIFYCRGIPVAIEGTPFVSFTRGPPPYARAANRCSLLSVKPGHKTKRSIIICRAWSGVRDIAFIDRVISVHEARSMPGQNILKMHYVTNSRTVQMDRTKCHLASYTTLPADLPLLKTSLDFLQVYSLFAVLSRHGRFR